MPKHSTPARTSKLIAIVGWNKTPEEFVEKLPLYISCIPDEAIRDAMARYYGGGKASQRTDPITGRPVTGDSRFYQLLRYGRIIIKALVLWEQQPIISLPERKEPIGHLIAG